MTWADPTQPNLPDFILFGEFYMGIDPLYLPLDSPFYGYAFHRALDLVIREPCGGIDYTLAVYNCAGHILVNTTPDQPGRTFFQGLRGDFKLLTVAVGVVQSTSDNGTSTSIAVPDALKQLTIGDLGMMKTPWGRAYLEYAQDFGGIWGLS